MQDPSSTPAKHTLRDPYKKVCIHSLPTYVAVPNKEEEPDAYAWSVDPANTPCVKNANEIPENTGQILIFRVSATTGNFKLKALYNAVAEAVHQVEVVKPEGEKVIDKKWNNKKGGGVFKMKLQPAGVYYGYPHIAEAFEQPSAQNMSVPRTKFLDYDDNPLAHFEEPSHEWGVQADGAYGPDYCYLGNEYVQARKDRGVIGDGNLHISQELWIFGKMPDIWDGLPGDAVKYETHLVSFKINTEPHKYKYWVERDGAMTHDPKGEKPPDNKKP